MLYRVSIVPFSAALAFTVASSLTTTQTMNALHWISQLEGATLHFKIGQVMQALQWLLVAIVALVCLGACCCTQEIKVADLLIHLTRLYEPGET